MVSSGVVSGLHRGNAGIHPIEDYLQTDASLPRGLAGGPMIDPSGRVVGMSTGLVLGSRVYLGQSGIGYAVPAEWIDRALAWIRSGAAPRADVQQVAVTLSPRPERPRLTGIDALRFFAGLDLVPQGDDRLVVASVVPGSELAHYKVAAGDVLQSVLSKKDWLHGAKDNSRWRSVHTVSDLETRLETAYSDLDFSLGLRFKSKDGTKRELYLWEILSPTAAL